ncbi:MAG: DUF2628 domain-containing protein [Clostridia bacterium]|nr:DUF2628 domain-containing protein [Clostridia bacterium]
MSLNLKGKSCAVCHAYLFEEDDVVFCPVCGAPHHRECYSKVGHCALEALHGTDEQYDKVMERKAREEQDKAQENSGEQGGYNRVKCPMCEEIYDNSLNSCPKCSTPNFRVSDGFAPFDFLGGVPADMDVGKGVTANEAKRFVLSNTQRYIPKFAAANAGKKASWNWMAFLVPCPWFLGRKMYLYGILTGILTVVLALFSVPFNNAVYSLGIDTANSVAAASQLASSISQIGTAPIVLSALGGFLSLVLMLLCGIFGDYIYSRHSINKIVEIKENSEDKDRDFAKKGGVNVLLAALGLFGTDMLASIIAMFL